MTGHVPLTWLGGLCGIRRAWFNKSLMGGECQPGKTLKKVIFWEKIKKIFCMLFASGNKKGFQQKG